MSALSIGAPNYGRPLGVQPGSGGLSVYNNDAAFVAFNPHTYKAVCWGNEGYGGMCEDVDFVGVTDIYATSSGAFLALDRTSGIGKCWGNPSFGGDCLCKGDVPCDFNGVTHVVTTASAFAAINSNTGKVECFPSTASACDGSESVDATGMTRGFGTIGAFILWNEDDEKVTCFGDANQAAHAIAADSRPRAHRPRPRHCRPLTLSSPSPSAFAARAGTALVPTSRA